MPKRVNAIFPHIVRFALIISFVLTSLGGSTIPLAAAQSSIPLPAQAIHWLFGVKTSYAASSNLNGTVYIGERGKSNRYLVSISQWDSHLSTGELTGDCILVYLDGRFYREHRWAKSNPPVAIHAFESVLTQEQLTQLKSIVDQQTIQELPSFVFPKTPFDVDRYAFFTAKIPRGAGVQNAGYFVWQGGYEKASPATMPDSVKKSWHDSELALQPLVGWFHELKSGKFPESQPVPSGCNPPRAK